MRYQTSASRAANCKFTTNVDYAKKELANRLGVDPNNIGDAIHKIKKAYGVGGAEKREFNVCTGAVRFGGEEIDNIDDYFQ